MAPKKSDDVITEKSREDKKLTRRSAMKRIAKVTVGAVVLPLAAASEVTAYYSIYTSHYYSNYRSYYYHDKDAPGKIDPCFITGSDN